MLRAFIAKAAQENTLRRLVVTVTTCLEQVAFLLNTSQAYEGVAIEVVDLSALVLSLRFLAHRTKLFLCEQAIIFVFFSFKHFLK